MSNACGVARGAQEVLHLLIAIRGALHARYQLCSPLQFVLESAQMLASQPDQVELVRPSPPQFCVG